MMHHGSEFERTHFQITQIRSSDVTGKKCIARKQSHGSAGLEQTQTNAIRRMTRCRDYLYIHRAHGESIAVFEVAMGKRSGRSLRKEDGRPGSARQLSMASHEIRVRMCQKNVSEFEPIFG